MKRVVIVMFDTEYHEPITLDCPEIRSTRQDTVNKTYNFINDNEVSIIRTYSDIPINMVGEMIDRGALLPTMVTVIQPSGVVSHFDEDGCLDENWVYGWFGYDIPREVVNDY